MDYIVPVLKIDGVQFFARDLAFFTPGNNLQIKYPLFVNKRHQGSFKGVRIIDGAREIYVVILGSQLDMEVALCFLPKEVNVDFKKMLELVNGALSNAFLELADSETGLQYGSSMMAVAPKNGVRIIQMNDIHRFSRVLYNQIQRQLPTLPGIDDVYYLLQGFGQSCDIISFDPVFQRIAFENLLEAVIHVALDYILEGSALLWKWDIIKCRESDNKVYGEYFAGAVRGAGNIYFTNQREQKPGEPSARVHKFYCELFKNAHRGTENPPFQKPTIAHFLWDSQFFPKPETNSDEFKLTSMAQICQQIQNTIEVTSWQSSIRARAEFIVSTTSPRASCVDDVLAHVEVEVRNRNIGDVDNFVSLPTQTLHQHVNDRMLPCLNTVWDEVKTRKRMWGSGNAPYIFDPRKYVTVSAAEAILSFFLYGTACSWKKKNAHNNQLCRALKLTASNFRQISLDNLFGDHISYCDDGTIEFWDNESNALTIQLISKKTKVDQLNFSNLLERLQVKNPNLDAAADLILAYLCKVAVSRSDKVANAAYELISIRELIVKSSSNQVGKQNGKGTFLTSLQFTKRILNFKNKRHATPGIYVLNCVLSYHFRNNTNGYEALLRKIAKLLHEQMLIANAPLIYPIGVHGHTLIAVPLLTFIGELSEISCLRYYEMLRTAYNMFPVCLESTQQFEMGLKRVLGLISSYSSRATERINLNKLFAWAQIYGSLGRNNTNIATLFNNEG